MLRAPVLHRLLVALALVATPLSGGCKTGPKLQKIEAPAAGITLRYDLAPGQTYVGHVRRSESVRDISGQSMTRSINFDITLTVRGKDDQRGGNLVVARFANVDLKWQLPPGLPFSLSDFTNRAKAQLQGMEVDFNVDDRGKVLFMPEVPEGAEELGLVISQVLDTLETAFLTAPEGPIKPGQSWTDEKKRGRKGKLGKYVEGSVTTTVDGLYRAEDGEEIAKLVITQTETALTTTKSGSHETKRQSKATSFFSTSGNYLKSTSDDTTDFDPGESTTFTKLSVEWSKTPRQGSPAPAPETQAITDPCNPDYVGDQECPGAESQSISDPCHPDYVGGEECKEAAPAP